MPWAQGGAGKFVKDKVLRLLVPLLVGDFTHASLQVYLERFTHGQFSGSYFQFLPHYFKGFYEGGNPASGNFALTGMHLWYLCVAVSVQPRALSADAVAQGWRPASALQVGRWVSPARGDLFAGAAGPLAADVGRPEQPDHALKRRRAGIF